MSEPSDFVTVSCAGSGYAVLNTPHVATLPDGARVNLPAGTTLREGMTWEGPPADPLRDLCNLFRTSPSVELATMVLKLREQVDRGASPLLDHARDLLRASRPWIAPGVPDVANPATEAQPAATIGKLRAAIDAFLAGKAPEAQEAPERTPAVVLHAMLIDAEREALQTGVGEITGESYPTSFRDAEGKASRIRRTLAVYLATGTLDLGGFDYGLCSTEREDYEARIAGTTPLDAPPAP